MDEARIAETETGKVVEGEGWFVLNLAEARWEGMEGAGAWCTFESQEARFAQFGANVHVVRPGEANGRYHAESDQEGFLVLAGECIAIVEGEERRLRRWDYLHCPSGTEHILVGAGDGPCAILMLGARSPESTIHYPVNEVAARHGASVATATDSPKEAYADMPREVTRYRGYWPTGAGSR
jgi:uncharacterized cupin superfamily protein